MKSILTRNWVAVFVTCFMALTIIAFVSTTDNIHNPALKSESMTITPSNIESPDAVTDILTLRIPSLEDNQDTMLFYTNHQEVYVHVGEELIYSLDSAESIFGRTPGAMWNFLHIPAGVSEIKVTLVQVYENLPKQNVIFEIGNEINMYRAVLDDSVLELLLTFAIVLIGFSLTIYWVLLFWKKNKQREILYLGLFALVFGIWNFGETQFAVFMFGNRAAWSYMAFTCLMIMCLPAIYFFREFLEVEEKIIYKIVVSYIVGETIIAQTLHLTGIVGAKQTAVYTVASIVLILMYLLFAIILSIKKRKHMRKIMVNIVGLTILVGTAVIDISSYFTNILTSVKVAKIGFLLYVIMLGAETVRAAKEQVEEEQKMEFIREMAVKDLLTGCYNRNAYTEDTAAIKDLKGIQIIGFDLNDLKKCNDTRGHQAGDKYISDAALLICGLFGGFGKVYRVGGDEFVVVARDVSEEKLLKRREQMAVEIQHYLLDNPDSGFGIACGFASYDESLDKNIEDIRNRADICMYENKKEIKG